MDAHAPLADMVELNLPPNITITFPQGKEKMMHFEITIRPDEGIYKWVHAVFSHAKK